MSSSFELKGLDEVRRRLLSLADKYPSVARQALNMEVELIATDAKQNYVPDDLGALRSSIHTQKAKIQPDKSIEAAVVAGGPAAPYALAVHENPSPHDPPTWEGVEVKFNPNGRGPKYIAKPMDVAVSGMEERLAQRIDRLVKGDAKVKE